MNHVKSFRKAWVDLTAAEKSRQLTLLLGSDKQTIVQWQAPWWPSILPSSLEQLPVTAWVLTGKNSQASARSTPPWASGRSTPPWAPASRSSNAKRQKHGWQ